MGRVALVIERECGVKYHPRCVWHILKGMGFSPQRPERRARERDEEAIAAWRAENWPKVKKSRDNGWPIVLTDESGYMLQPVVRRTWAPRQSQHPRPCFRIHDRNITLEQVVEFLTLLRGQLRRKFILVLDRYSAHRKAVRVLKQAHPDWFEADWLPAYAPELNPVEMVWNHSKYGFLANFLPGDAQDLREAVTASLEGTTQQPSLLRSFFRYAALQL